MSRLYGYVPSPQDERDWSLERLGAPLASIPDEINRDGLIEKIYNQRGSSCTGWGTARGWHLRARIQGDKTVAFPSAPLIYTEGRIADSASPTAPLEDVGCYPRLTLLATQKLGVVPLESWNDPSKDLTRPDWEILTESADARGVTFARVYGLDAMKRALAAGFPLVVGFKVDASFEDYRGGVWDGMRGQVLGGHCTCIFSYDAESLRGANSWDYDWGESGLYRISNRAAESEILEAFAVQLVENVGAT